MIISELTTSLSVKSIPLTPEVPRHIDLISVSLNLTILPFLAPITTSSVPVVFLTAISSSFSFSIIEIFPLFLMLLNSSIGVLFTKPFFVVNSKYLILSSFESNSTIERMFSFLSNDNKLTIGIPFDCLLNSGIS